MPIEVPTSRRLATAATWPVGMLWTSFIYIWRTTPIHRRQLEGSLEGDCPPPLPDDVDLSEIKRPEDGAGPLLHRTYSALIAEGRYTPEALMKSLQADPDQVAPRALAKFRKTAGSPRGMRVGDEFLVHMPGPWDGPVRAVHVDEHSFRFATLEGHLEAGQIEWRAAQAEDMVLFQIESWARTGDRLSAIAHDRLLMAKEVQLHMWSSVLERVAKFARGRLVRGIDVDTRRVDGKVFESQGC